jgi:hypothetical protein
MNSIQNYFSPSFSSSAAEKKIDESSKLLYQTMKCKNGKNIIFPVGSQKNVENTEFIGSPFYNVVGMYFISHKHDNVCVVMGEPYKFDETKNPKLKDGVTHTHTENCILLPKSMSNIPDSHLEVSLRWIEKKKDDEGYISVPKPEKKFWEDFNGCLNSNKRFIVLPFGFNCLDSGHQNYLLYDKDTHILRRFETFGDVDTECLSNARIDECIDELFRNNVKKFKEYVKPLEFLPENSFQTIQEDEKEMHGNDPVGFCSVWSIWLIDLCLSNPNIQIKELMKIAMSCLKQKKRQGQSFTSFIRDYSVDLVKVGEIIKKELKSMDDGWKSNKTIEIDGLKRKRRSRKMLKSTIKRSKKSRLRSRVRRRSNRISGYRIRKSKKRNKKFDGSVSIPFPSPLYKEGLKEIELSIQIEMFSTNENTDNNIYLSKDFKNLLQYFEGIVSPRGNITETEKNSVLMLATYYWKMVEILKDINQCRKHLMKKENLTSYITRETYIKKWKLYQSAEFINNFVEKIRRDIRDTHHKITPEFKDFLQRFPELLRNHMVSLKCH